MAEPQDSGLDAAIAQVYGQEQGSGLDAAIAQVYGEQDPDTSYLGLAGYSVGGAAKDVAGGLLSAAGGFAKMTGRIGEELREVSPMLDPVGAVFPEFRGALGETLEKAAPDSGQQGFIPDVAMGTGSSLFFLAAAAPLAAVGAPAAVTGLGVAYLGAISNGGQEFYEQLAAEPGNEGKAWEAFAGGALIGTSEALPLGRILNRINKASGGALGRAILREMAVEGLEEFVQEGGQSLASDIIAAHLREDELPYFEAIAKTLTDPESLKRAARSGAVGAVAVGPISGGASIAQAVLHSREAQEAEKPPPTIQDSDTVPDIEGQTPESFKEQVKATGEAVEGAGSPTVEGPIATVEAEKVAVAPTPEEIAAEGETIEDPDLRSLVAANRKAGQRGPIEIVAPEAVEGTEGDAALVADRGVAIEYVQGDGPLPVNAAYKEGRILLDARSDPQTRRKALLVHEFGHHFRATFRGERPVAGLIEALEAIEPGLLESSGEKYAALLEARTGGTLDSEALEDEATTFLFEKGYGAVLRALEDPARLRAIAERNPGVIRRIVDWILEWAAKHGMAESPEWKRLKEAVGDTPTPLEEYLGAAKSAQLGLAAAETFNIMSGMGEGRTVAGKRQQSPASADVPGVSAGALHFVADGDQFGPEYRETIHALDGEEVVGSLKVSHLGDEVSVLHVEVVPSRRRQGVARSLYRELVRLNPDSSIGTLGVRTSEGQAMREALESEGIIPTAIARTGARTVAAPVVTETVAVQEVAEDKPAGKAPDKPRARRARKKPVTEPAPTPETKPEKPSLDVQIEAVKAEIRRISRMTQPELAKAWRNKTVVKAQAVRHLRDQLAHLEVEAAPPVYEIREVSGQGFLATETHAQAMVDLGMFPTREAAESAVAKAKELGGAMEYIDWEIQNPAPARPRPGGQERFALAPENLPEDTHKRGTWVGLEDLPWEEDGSLPEEDGFLYHVTSEEAAQSIMVEGFRSHGVKRRSGSDEPGWGPGEVYFTDVGGIPFWLRGVTDGDAAIFRIEKSALEDIPSSYDFRGARDAGAGAYGFDSRFALAPEGEPSADSSIPTQTQEQRLFQTVVDTMEPLLRAAKATGQAAFKVVHDRATLYGDRGAHRIAKYEKEKITPFVTKVKELGKGALEKADKYLMARHAPERNRVIAERYEEQRRELQATRDAAAERRTRSRTDEAGAKLDEYIARLDKDLAFFQAKQEGSGMSDLVARQIVKGAERSAKGDVYREIGVLWDEMMSDNLDMAVEYGLLPQSEVDIYRENYDHYVPLKTLMDEREARGMGIGRGADVRGPEFKKAMGRSTLADAPIAHGLEAIHRTIMRGEKTRVGLPLLQLFRDHPEELKALGTLREPRFIEDNFGPESELVIGIKEKGVEQRIQFEPEYAEFAEAMHALTAKQVDAISRHVGKVTRTLSAMATRYNPVFPVFNAVRDTSGAFINSSEHGIAFASQVMRDIPAAWATMSGLNKSPEWLQVREDFEASGGKMATLGLDDVYARGERLEADLSSLRDLNSGKGRSFLRSVMEMLAAYSDAVENMARLSYFKNARSMLGMTNEQAAHGSKELTTNFRKKGLYGSTINSWWMFSTAGIEGTHRVARALKNRNVQKMTAGIVFASAMLDTINRMVSGDDDDGTPIYDGIPDYVKRNNITIMLPGGRQAITIPAPFVYNWFHTLGTKLSELAWSAFTDESVNTLGGAIGDMAVASVDSFNPLGGTDQPLTLILPTLLDPLAEIATNKDFAGRQIARKPFPGQTMPPSEQYWPSVNPTARAISSKINEWTGGDKFEAGGVSVNPEHIEYLSKFLTSGVGATAGRVYNIPDKMLRGEEVMLHEVPLIRRFLRNPSPFALGSRYRESVQEVETVAKRIETLRSEGKGKEAAEAMKRDRPLWVLRARVKAAKRRIKVAKDRAGKARTDEARERFESQIRTIQAGISRTVREAQKPETK